MTAHQVWSIPELLSLTSSVLDIVSIKPIARMSMRASHVSLRVGGEGVLANWYERAEENSGGRSAEVSGARGRGGGGG